MSAYSLCGYLVAVKMRGERTLLVEGKTDKKILSRLFADNEDLSLFLDTVDIVRDEKLPKGNRRAVEFIYNEAESDGLPVGAVVDREFRGFRFFDAPRDEFGTHHKEGLSLFFTRGHSIENYLFEQEYVVSYLKLRFSDVLRKEDYELVQTSFEDIVTSADALSVAVHMSGLVKKSTGIVNYSFWTNSDVAALVLDVEKFAEALGTRSVEERVRQEFVELFTQAHRGYRGEPCRWMIHGHLGWELIWSGVGHVLSLEGASTETVEAISNGFSDEKLMFLADCWARKEEKSNDEYPLDLINWVGQDTDTRRIRGSE